MNHKKIITIGVIVFIVSIVIGAGGYYWEKLSVDQSIAASGEVGINVVMD
jgi:hypothetical protein